MIDITRILDRLTELEAREEWEEARKLLEYWQKEAEDSFDKHSALTLHNELMGLNRKMRREEDALAHADRALALLSEADMAGTITEGTVLVNAATVCQAFGHTEKSLELFRRAEASYQNTLPADDPRRGGLYNNMGLCLTDLERFPEARGAYLKAYETMASAENGQLEQAITLLNLADLEVAEKGIEAAEPETNRLLEEAYCLLSDPTLPQNGYFAFVCDKCAPVFGYYGYFLYENTLKQWSREIHERS